MKVINKIFPVAAVIGPSETDYIIHYLLYT